jgi:hypothetical protein
MNPAVVIEKLLSVEPGAARLILVGLAVLAAAAIATAWSVDRAGVGDLAILIIGFGVIVSVLAFVLTDGAMKAVVGWVVVVSGLVYGAAVFAAGVVPSLVVPPLNPVQCVVRFWLPCNAVGGAADVAAAENATRLAPVPAVAPVPAPAGPAVTPANYAVTVQFAGQLVRDDVRTMMQTLRGAGWRVQGVEGGGQRTSTAAGYNEVRYGDEADLPAATELARQVQAANLVTRQVRPVRVPSIPRGRLEVYISR